MSRIYHLCSGMDSFTKFRFQTTFDNKSFQKLIDEFYFPVFCSSNLISFFGNGISVSNLEFSARGIIYSINNGAKINILLTHAKFPDNEAETKWTQNIKAEILGEISEGLAHPYSLRQQKYIEILAWFLKNGCANIKVLPASNKNDSFYNNHFLSSSNISIYRDNNLQVIYSQRLLENPEIIKLHWSWGDPEKIAIKAQSIYDELFNDEQVDFEFSQELRNLISQYCPKVLPANDPGLEEDKIIGKDIKEISLWKHQKKAFEAWFENECRGIFKMCTGAGKTIAALFCIKELAERKVKAASNLGGIVIACPTKVLVEQWQKELKKFGFNRVLNAYESVLKYIDKLSIYLDSTKRREGCWIVVTTYKTFLSDAFSSKIKLAQLDSQP